MSQTKPPTDHPIWLERLGFFVAGFLPVLLILRVIAGPLDLDKLGRNLTFGGIALAFACTLRARRLQRLTTLLNAGILVGVILATAGVVLLVISIIRDLLPA
ncbi:MAG TPA: hypothetical protein VK157_13630 [Phycisphaerales bacterium]|nr:hypothetical protein [Phycisphaerales bacterium]